jgi:hypothetical protein
VPDEKELQFNRMWNEENGAKRIKFRNWIKSKLDVFHVEVTEENARAFYTGRLSRPPPERLYQIPERGEEGPRDRGRGPPRRRGPR